MSKIIDVSSFSELLLVQFFLKLACNEHIHTILDEFNFQPDWTDTSHRFIMEKTVVSIFSWLF